MISIPDTFTNETGFTNYAIPVDFAVPVGRQTGNHVDLRIFDNAAVIHLVTMSDLDTDSMTSLDTEAMTVLESTTSRPGEGWDSTGTTGAGSLVVGNMTTFHKGWYGARLTATGGAISAVLTSSMTTAQAVNVTQFAFFSVMARMFGPGATTGATVKFNSDPNGVFGNGFDSGLMTLTPNGVGAHEFRIATGALSAGSCDLTAVTGIRFTITTNGSPLNGDFLRVAAVRCYDATYAHGTSGIDINTIREAVVIPVTLDFDPTSLQNIATPMVRGSQLNLATDPRGQDATSRMLIKIGANLDTVTNQIKAIFREDSATDQYTQVTFTFSSTGASWQAQHFSGGIQDITSATFALTGGQWTTVTGAGYFIFEASVVKNTVQVNVYLTNQNEAIGTIAYTSPTINVPGFEPTQGRIGWGINWGNHDLQLLKFDSVVTVFSTLITKASNSLTPVDGVQLTAAYSLDDNLFADFTGSPVPVIDTQRTLSGDGSYRTTGPLVSNIFTAAKFEQAYLEFDIWVPATVSAVNQPKVALRSPVSVIEINPPALDLQGDQWNHIVIDMSETQAAPNANGIPYQVFIERTEGAGTSYEWNIDNFVIGVRNVAWSARTSSTNAWAEFRNTVNDDAAALNFGKGYRGTALQIQAQALTSTAWIGPFTIKPHYAQLGRPKSGP